MTLVPSSFPTSRKNAVASVLKHLQDTNAVCSPWSLLTSEVENTLALPSVSVVERTIPDIGPTAYGDYLGQAVNGTKQFYGHESQFLLEFNIAQKNTTTYRDAEEAVGLERERIWHSLFYAGCVDESGTEVMPNIKLYDFDTNPISETGSFVWWPSEESNTWFEEPIYSDSADPNLKRKRLNVRFRYTTAR